MVKKQRGQALVVITVCLMALLGMLALVIDTGRAYVDHARLQRAVDAAALAAVQDLPEDVSTAEKFAEDAFKYNNKGEALYEISFVGPPTNPDKVNTAIVTAQKTIENQMAHFLGYEEWPIVAQAVARSGPISSINHWIPIGVEEGEINLYEHMRLGNTTHTQANDQDKKRIYYPLQRGDLRSDVANTINSNISVNQNLQVIQNPDVKKICQGLNDRLTARLSVKGCFDSTDTFDPAGLNIVGPGMRKDWAYGEDPRLVYIPFVEVVDKNTVKVKGFGLFYIEYAHYDEDALGSTSSLTEIVGYFVKTVVEGPVMNDTTNYGVVGIEYVDLNKVNK